MELKASGSDVRTLLRLADEPCLYLNEEQVHRLLVDRFDQLLYGLESALRRQADGLHATKADGIKKIYTFDDSPGDFRIMAFDDGRDMTVKLIGTNEAGSVVPDKISVGKLLIMHPVDHFIMGILDVCVLSSLRTAMGVLVAYRSAGLPPPARLGIVGAGRVGMYIAWAFHRAGLIDECLLADPSPAHIAATARLCELEGGPTCRAASLAEVLAGSDTVALATASRVPIVSRQHLQSNRIQFLASVGADADTLSELDDDVPGAVRLLVGSPLCFGVGDLKRWRGLGLIPETDVRYLTRADAPRPDGDDRPVCYVSTGFPVLDHVAGQLAFEAATANRVGRWIHRMVPEADRELERH